MNKKHKYNQEVIKELSKRYEVTADFVRKSLRKARHSDKSEAIRKDYIRTEKALHKVTQAVIENVIQLNNE